jgi:hypothetical protein
LQSIHVGSVDQFIGFRIANIDEERYWPQTIGQLSEDAKAFLSMRVDIGTNRVEEAVQIRFAVRKTMW